MGRFGAAMAALLLCAVAYDEGVAGRRRRARPADAAGPESPRRRGRGARRRPDPDDPRPRRRRRAVDADLRNARGESRARRAPLAMATRREGDLHLVEEPAAVPPPAADASRYVFVGGTHGSGTSLLYKLFGAPTGLGCLVGTRAANIATGQPRCGLCVLDFCRFRGGDARIESS